MAVGTTPGQVPLSDIPEGDRQRERFLQDRLGRFGLVVGALTGMFWVFTVGIRVVLGRGSIGECVSSPESLWHLVAMFVPLGLWAMTRRRHVFRTPQLIVADTLALLALGVSTGAMGWWIEHAGRHGHGLVTGFMAIGVVVIAHAIIVPTTGRRGLVVRVLALLPALATYVYPPTSVDPELIRRGLPKNILWSACYVTLAVVASQALHGLRQKVRQARQLGQYRLDEKIGQGGMGQVFRATHSMLRRPTAIKLLPPGNVTPQQLERFEREVQLTAELTHPNTISVFDYGRTPDGVFYYAMEYLEGLTLDQLVTREGPQPPARVIHLLVQICGALGEAHTRGLIHRDIKPANIFLCQRGGVPDFIKVLDFGLVKDISGVHPSSTGVDVVAGTPQYLAPEAITDPSRVDARSDIYALGALAYFLLSGRPVFVAQTVVAVCSMHLHEQPKPLAEHVATPIPAALEALVMGCLAKQPDARPASAQAMLTTLRELASAHPWSLDQAQQQWEMHMHTNEPPTQPVSHAFALGETVQIDLAHRRG